MNENIDLSLKNLFSEVSNREITSNTKDIREFGMDSLQFITFAVKIEEKFEIEFEFDDIENIVPFSINNIKNYILKKRG
ncbi:MAG: phosphopantetheine-binding protein [Acetobacter sp.]|nr:phosphopantetheine-binding protein [Bacteroides sp.]MCM1340795.1 phosphopantetheine-binding protein [Acetobacter sp.]MCM1432648.1 phosphopantetheine-binding protein [Clostridiales bacterium]